MNSQTIRRMILGAFAIVLGDMSTIVSAQSTFGSIVGTVLDTSGGPIAGTEVTVRNTSDNTTRTAVSDNAGEYQVLNLRPGPYEISGSKEGFAVATITGATLDARQQLRADLKLEVAGVKQSVTVEDTAAAVNTDSQRNIAVGGATSSMVGFSVDGISTASVRSNGALLDAYPSSEGIQEMKITAFNNNAEFSQLGDVTFITKSGNNQFHGSLFEYLQNDKLDSTIFNFPDKAPKRFNTFGGSVGGPVSLPKLYNGKDRTFFFFDYEGNRRRTSVPQQLLVPTQAERNGDLSALVAAYGSGPVTRT